jgi:hypothetical protein
MSALVERWLVIVLGRVRWPSFDRFSAEGKYHLK